MDFSENAYTKIKILKPKVKDKTIETYLLNIKKISKELFNSTKPSVQYFKDIESIKDYISSMKSLASQKNMVTSILVLIKSYNDVLSEDTINLYNDYHKELSKKQENNYLDNNKTQREEENWITRNDIFNKINSLKNEIDTWNKKLSKRKLVDKTQQHLVLNLYTLLPPLRNDYAIVKVVDDPLFENNEESIDASFNYINLATKKLLLCNYKTNKFYGIKKIDLPDALYDIICSWENTKKQFFDLNHTFLLLNTTNASSMKHNTLTKYINKIFTPKKVSSTLLRKVYLSEKYPVVNTYRDQLHDSFVMGHSVNTQKMVYSKR